MLPQRPAAPPTREIITASVRSWRRMRLRAEPRASRRATSRPRSAARVQEVGAIGLPLINERKIEIGIEDQEGAVKGGRRHPDDGERMLVEADHAADHPGVVVKMRMPVSVREHDIGSAVRAMLVGS